ncbi:hypothetical protein [Sphingomonas sp.]|uniref:hypothetical protein n=1 Tax=Sphingomonas sp. TaxID=28214 RepID=UPI001DCE67E9|nr:hypothetical protein [Sphingomonas sp.]MBX9797306.1 hypothetical protein [Sphingomonas sp.]
MTRSYPLALLPVLALAACGSKEREQTIRTADGSSMKIEQREDGDGAKITATSKDGKQIAMMTAGPGSKWPADAAPYAPAYPGGEVTGSMGGTAADGTGSIVTFTTADSPDKVVEFYKARAQAAGLNEVSTMDINGAKMFSASDKGGGRSIAVQTSVNTGKTTAVVTSGSKK